MFARVEDGQVVEYPILDIRARCPESSIPEDFSSLPDGFYKVVATTPSTFNNKTHKLIPAEYPKFEQNAVYLEYVVVPISEQELEEIRQNNIESIRTDIEVLLEDFAQQRGYTSLSAPTYADSTVEKFRKEGKYFKYIRDKVWEAADIVFNIDMDPKLEKVLAASPKIDWNDCV